MSIFKMPELNSTNIIFGAVCFIIIVTMMCKLAEGRQDWTRPLDYCANGVCDGSLYVPGNFTVIGDYVNITVVDFNITNNMNVNGNVSADYFFGIYDGNSTIWNRSGTNIYPSNLDDFIGINTSTPHKPFVVNASSYFGGRMNFPNGGYVDPSLVIGTGQNDITFYAPDYVYFNAGYANVLNGMRCGDTASTTRYGYWGSSGMSVKRAGGGTNAVLTIEDTNNAGSAIIDTQSEDMVLRPNSVEVLRLETDGNAVFSNNVSADYFFGIFDGSFEGDASELYDFNYEFSKEEGLISFFPFEETADDYSGSNDGIVNSVSNSSDGRIGSAFSFDGVDDSVNFTTTLTSSTTATISVWINPEEISATDNSIVTGYDGGGIDSGEWIIYLNNDDKIYGFVGTDGEVSYPYNDYLNEWHHVAVTVAPNDIRLYIDGVNVNTDNTFTSSIFGDDALRIGADLDDVGGNRHFKGKIDEVKISNRSLSIAEIRFEYMRGINHLDKSKNIIFSNNVSIAENLDVNGDVQVRENLNVTKNITGNFIHAELWNYSAPTTPGTFNIDTADTYYNFTNFSAGSINGFTYLTDGSNGTVLIVGLAGLYKADLTISFAGETAGGLYGVAIVEDFDVNNNRNCYSREEAKTTVENVAVTCNLDLLEGSKVNVQIENENANRDIYIHTANLNLVRIAD